MARENRTYCILILIFCTQFLYNCESEEEPLGNDELIFRESFPIEINSYDYIGANGKIYRVHGDSEQGQTPDTVDDAPVIGWNSATSGLVSAGIFDAPVRVSGGEIVNTDNLVWQWHSGMNIDSVGYVQFSEGRNVINGVIDYQNNPTVLAEGNYYWAIWSWSSSGVRILFSSREKEFYVVK